MSEYDSMDRTEEATPRKLEEAREKGHVARSQDLSTAIILLGGLMVLKFWGHYPLDAMTSLTRGALGNLDARAMDGADLYATLGSSAILVLRAMVPVIAGLLVVALAANVVQTGFLFSSDPITPKFERLNPIAGLKRLWSRRGLMRLMAGLFKLAVVGLVAGFAIHGRIAACTGLSDASAEDIFAFVGSSTFDVALKVSLALLALALADFAYQRWQHLQDLRMTKQEVRDELKRMEGDPLMRDRRRRLQRRTATQRMMHRVPAADVVIAAPGGAAVALRYDAGTMDAPAVVAKGRGHLAARIREVAEDCGVAVVERGDLAAALDRACDVGAAVPSGLFVAVAEVLAYAREVHRMRDARRALSVA